MMYQDKTGMTFLDYTSAFGFIGNFFFAISKVKTLIGKPSTVLGWFRRDMSSKISLQYIETTEGRIVSHPILWSGFGAVLIIIAWFVITSFSLG